MNFDQLMEMIEGDEEMGYMEMYQGNDVFMDIKTIDGKRTLNIHFYAIAKSTFEVIQWFFHNNDEMRYKLLRLEGEPEQLKVDAEAFCFFLPNHFREEQPNFIIGHEGEHVELVDVSAHLQVRRTAGKKKLEITFFINIQERRVMEMFLKSNNAKFSQTRDGFWEQLEVDLAVNCTFSSIRS